MNILWFAQSGTTSSFSRITDTVIPLILSKNENNEEYKNNKITLLSLLDGINLNDNQKKNYTFVKTGSDTTTILYNDFINNNNNNNNNDKLIELNMKYILIQIADLLINQKIYINESLSIANTYTHIVILNGLYETEFFVSRILSFTKDILKDVKVVPWVPIDYVPPKSIIEKFKSSYKFITMTPVMKDIVKDLEPDLNVDWVGHGYELSKKDYELSKKDYELKTITREKAIKLFNKLKLVKSKIDLDTIYILNANNCKAKRKRIDITIEAFKKIFLNLKNKRSNLKIKLWLHTDLNTLLTDYLHLITDDLKDSIIVSNNVSDYQLMLIYKICQIGLQTSEGEGWSLTNTEHSMYGCSLQIVPNFLATGYHFSFDRGLLIPVKEIESKNEQNENVKICSMTIENVSIALIKGINLIKENKHLEIVNRANEHLKQFSWKNVVNEFLEKIV